ncbi:hypothetical protein L1987_22980 [Smallanthus sonchifolius]|uniref:Uncharacterized protein n=1 Tax=Smallanthus sonchifolius TaxID=185202 RepID=A0ACB9IGC0_9ASTR|nr:hypothetical protein L1987_22980 [Smallanthus sonchifolius]
MKPAGGGDGGGLARFQSVPTTWLEALLLSDDDIIIDSPKSTFNQHPPTITTDLVDPGLILPGPDSGFLRQNSSPVEFLSHVSNSDDYGITAKANYDDHLSSPLNVKDVKFTTQMDSARFRVRAKRGFATHPRSIAERIRRTRISDRIRKLQELVPNMDKQTNTADMLEEAVEYVKFLQNQIQFSLNILRFDMMIDDDDDALIVEDEVSFQSLIAMSNVPKRRPDG